MIENGDRQGLFAGGSYFVFISRHFSKTALSLAAICLKVLPHFLKSLVMQQVLPVFLSCIAGIFTV